MSDFSEHDFICDTTEHFGGDAWNPPGIASRYFCGTCHCVFVHYYHFRPDIYEALEVAGIPDTCERLVNAACDVRPESEGSADE